MGGKEGRRGRRERVMVFVVLNEERGKEGRREGGREGRRVDGWMEVRKEGLKRH